MGRVRGSFKRRVLGSASFRVGCSLAGVAAHSLSYRFPLSYLNGINDSIHLDFIFVWRWNSSNRVLVVTVVSKSNLHKSNSGPRAQWRKYAAS